MELYHKQWNEVTYADHAFLGKERENVLRQITHIMGCETLSCWQKIISERSIGL